MWLGQTELYFNLIKHLHQAKLVNEGLFITNLTRPGEKKLKYVLAIE